MNFKLQILVPQYDEDETIIHQLLDSIALQQNVDFKNEIGVIIVNDGNAKSFLSDEFLKKYPFEIQYFKEPHRGVSAARQFALDKATADYVMFCDADDMFLSMCGLYIIFNEIRRGFDGLTSLFLEEYHDERTGLVTYINHEFDTTFVHGKVYRRYYLLDKGIKWCPDLTIHEDSYFNLQCQKFTKKENILWCPYPFYLWKWRENSVCRHDKLYLQKTWVDMIKNLERLVPLFINRGYLQEARELVVFSVMDAYYSLNKKEWLDTANKQFRDNTEKKFYEFFVKYKNLYDSTDEMTRIQIQKGVRDRMFMEGLGFENLTFEQWMNHLKREFGQN